MFDAAQRVEQHTIQVLGLRKTEARGHWSHYAGGASTQDMRDLGPPIVFYRRISDADRCEPSCFGPDMVVFWKTLA